ncbi:MAG TPA: hypothetical protein VH120_07510 [Gemmataceae bacterium]|nr:hypothetical protein [Gemmataceae bacterium]
MPIRFRCVYCNQLLGISRRKAGTIVRCTSCEGQLIVPEPSDAAAPAGPPEQPPAPTEKSDASGPKPFEAAEFDAFLEPLSAGGGPIVANPPALAKRLPTVAEVQSPVFSLTMKGLWIGVGAALLALGVSFAAGLTVGLALH